MSMVMIVEMGRNTHSAREGSRLQLELNHKEGFS